MRTSKVIEAAGKNMQMTIRAMQGPPPPPPTLGQRVADWLWRYVVPPLGQVCMVVGLTGAVRFGWELFR